MQFNVHSAKTQLSKLIEAALNGEEVVIARGNVPVVKLVPVKATTFRLGGLEQLAGTVPDFEDPMEADDLALWEGRG